MNPPLNPERESDQAIPPAPAPERQAIAANALSIVLIYAIFASLWILLSDKVVQWISTNPEQAALASTVKGWLFVLVTSLLLLRLMRHKKGRTAPTSGTTRPTPVLVLISVAIVILTAFTIAENFISLRDTEVARLQTIADIAAREIGKGIKERVDLAIFVQTQHQLADRYSAWQTRHDKTSGDLLRAQLDQLRQTQKLAAIQLLNEEGRHLWSSTNATAELDPPLKAAVERSITDHAVRWVGPYRDASGVLSLDFIAPIITTNGRPPLVVMHTDPGNWLYPTLLSWPVPSSSGETLLFRRDGDQVLFLNELRHRQDTAAKLKIPLSVTALLASQAITGAAKTSQWIEGEDYRGVAVLGVMRPVPSTDWFLIAKIDRSELYGAAGQSTLWIILAGLLSLFVAVAGVHVMRQRQQLDIAKNIQQAQADRLRSLQLLSAIADGSNDAIFAQDGLGRYILFNRTACAFVGKAEQDVLGRDDRAIYPPAQADALAAIARQAMAENRNIVSEELYLATPDGERIFFSTRGPLHDADGKVVGTFGIHQDITARKKSEQAVLESENRFRGLVEQSLAGIYIIQDGRFSYVNPVFASIFGYDSAEAFTSSCTLMDPVAPESRELVMEKIRERMAGNLEVDHYTFTGLRKDGSRIEVEVHGRTFDHQGKRAVIGVILDITARKAAEDALRASETRFQDIAQASADWIWEVDTEGRYTYVSGSIKEMLDYAPEEILGKTPMDFMTPEDAARVAPKFFAAVAAGAPLPYIEHNSLRKDGSLCYVQANGVPIRDKDGKIVGYRGIGRNISERRRAEEELRNSEARFHTLFDNASVAIMIHDCDTLAVLDANRRAVEVFGHETLDDLQRGGFWDAPPYSLEDAIRLGRKVRREGPQHFEWRRHDKDGNVIWNDVLLNSIVLDGRERLLSITTDLTARKAAEEALSTNARYLRAVLDNFPFMVWLKDTESRFLAANAACAKVANVTSPEDMTGHDDTQFWPADLAQQYRADDRAVLESGKPKVVEEEMEEPGRRFWVETYKSPVELEGRIIGTVGFARDITERKANEAELRNRYEELQRFNKLMVGRELDMIALKQRINELSLQLGLPAPYSLSFLNGAASVESEAP